MTQFPGLSSTEAASRLAASGANEIHKPRARNIAAIAGGTLREPMFLLLIAAAGLYLALGDIGEGLFLAAGAGLTIGLVVYQEARSEGALKALRSLAQPHVHVIRDGMDQRIEARCLVVGDIVLVEEGQRIPADARLVSGDVISVDESTLTGESVPVSRRPARADTLPEQSELLAGALVVHGAGVAEVTATGVRTALGQIGASLASTQEEATPLQKTTRRLVGYLAVAALAFCLIVFLAYGVLRNAWLQGGLTAITVAISLLPEEFPMVLAVFLAIGSWRLARHNVLVRRSAVIEALGGATLLCVDKTGTLTVNRMTLVRAWANGAMHDLEDVVPETAEIEELLRAAALASAVRSIDPMDRAIFQLAPQTEDLPAEPDRTWPLQPERLAVIHLWREPSGSEIAVAKGAPEAIFRMCRLSPDQTLELQPVLETFASDGLRVLAVAQWRHSGAFPEDPGEATFRFLGFIGFMDPLREDVPDALLEARAAGIGIAMITGDHPATALEIARQAGIDISAGAWTGADIDARDDAALQKDIGQVRVFARIAPRQKLRLVQAFKGLGEVVVMTGDGVNDGPALQASHIGIAMGRRGTDVAREAADIVLLDDSFASIVGGVRMGRRIFANLRKALTYITAIHVPLAGLALAPILLGWPPLFLPMHVVFLELVIDPVCSLVFEAEPSEAQAMRQPPRKKDEPLFGPRHIAFAFLQGGVVFLAIGLYFGWALSVTGEPEARGAAFASLVMANLTLALADALGGRAGLFHPSRSTYWIIVAVASIALAAALFVPFLAELLQMAPPPADVMTIGVAVALLSGGWFRILKSVQEQWRRREVA